MYYYWDIEGCAVLNIPSEYWFRWQIESCSTRNFVSISSEQYGLHVRVHIHTYRYILGGSPSKPINTICLRIGVLILRDDMSSQRGWEGGRIPQPRTQFNTKRTEWVVFPTYTVGAHPSLASYLEYTQAELKLVVLASFRIHSADLPRLYANQQVGRRLEYWVIF